MSKMIKVRVPEETLEFFAGRMKVAEKDLRFADEMHSTAFKAWEEAMTVYTAAMDFNSSLVQAVKDAEAAVGDDDPRGDTDLLHHLRVVLRASDEAVLGAADELAHCRQVMLDKHNRVIQLQSDLRVVERILERIEIE